MTIDTHTHAFPDGLAPRAMAALLAEIGETVTPSHDGTIAGLLARMDEAGVQTSVIASIATRPKHFQPILAWSREIASDRLVPFCSVHPDDPDALGQVEAIAGAGFRGIKLHPYYQQFVLDDPRMIPIYRRIAARGLVLLCHTGFDIAFPRDRIADPRRIAGVLASVPELKFIASHLGAWEDWDEVERFLLGRPVWMDISFAHRYLGAERMRRMLLAHPAEYLLFGSDSPWDDPALVLAQLRAMQLPRARERAILHDNAQRLLGL